MVGFPFHPLVVGSGRLLELACELGRRANRATWKALKVTLPAGDLRPSQNRSILNRAPSGVLPFLGPVLAMVFVLEPSCSDQKQRKEMWSGASKRTATVAGEFQ